jgi:putative oxidoreductase
MKNFPFLSARQLMILLRCSLSLIFLAHAVVRVIGGTIERFGTFLNDKGLVVGVPLVWMITAFELVGAVLLAAGYFTKWISAGFIALLIFGIILIHASRGWFVGEHGSGGIEYSFILIVSFLVVARGEK